MYLSYSRDGGKIDARLSLDAPLGYRHDAKSLRPFPSRASNESPHLSAR
jgi:hypothetical protein